MVSCRFTAIAVSSVTVSLLKKPGQLGASVAQCSCESFVSVEKRNDGEFYSDVGSGFCLLIEFQPCKLCELARVSVRFPH